MVYIIQKRQLPVLATTASWPDNTYSWGKTLEPGLSSFNPNCILLLNYLSSCVVNISLLKSWAVSAPLAFTSLKLAVSPHAQPCLVTICNTIVIKHPKLLPGKSITSVVYFLKILTSPQLYVLLWNHFVPYLYSSISSFNCYLIIVFVCLLSALALIPTQ